MCFKPFYPTRTPATTRTIVVQGSSNYSTPYILALNRSMHDRNPAKPLQVYGNVNIRIPTVDLEAADMSTGQLMTTSAEVFVTIQNGPSSGSRV